jgi:hypothetical protein
MINDLWKRGAAIGLGMFALIAAFAFYACKQSIYPVTGYVHFQLNGLAREVFMFRLPIIEMTLKVR